MLDASKMPLPEADKKLKLKTAFSAVGLATSGGTRKTSLSRPGTRIFGAEMPSKNAFVSGNPQTKTTTLRMIHGSQAWNISDFDLRLVSEARASARATLALPDGRASDTTRSLPLPVLTSNRQMRFGCQNFMKNASAAIETIAA